MKTKSRFAPAYAAMKKFGMKKISLLFSSDSLALFAAKSKDGRKWVVAQNFTKCNVTTYGLLSDYYRTTKGNCPAKTERKMIAALAA